MKARSSAQTLPIPAKQWATIITAFYKQLGEPTRVEPDGEPVNATLVVWGTGKAELSFSKDLDEQHKPNDQNFFWIATHPRRLMKYLKY